MRRFPLQQTAATDCADELSLADGNFSAYHDNVRSAFELPAFEGAVIYIHDVRLCRNRSLILWIEDDEIGIRSNLDGAFARKQAKYFCNVCARDIHEGVKIDAPRCNAVGVKQFDAFFQAGNSVWDLGEILFTHRLL